MATESTGVDRKGKGVAVEDSPTQAFLATTPGTILIKDELPHRGNIRKPQFLKGAWYRDEIKAEWENEVLPHLAKFKFEITTVGQAKFMQQMIKSGRLPKIVNGIHYVSVPDYYFVWGKQNTGKKNAYNSMLNLCTDLRKLDLTFHTGMLRKLVKDGEEKILSPQDFAKKYNARVDFYWHPQIEHIRIFVERCDRTAAIGRTDHFFGGLIIFIQAGNKQHMDRNPRVELLREGDS